MSVSRDCGLGALCLHHRGCHGDGALRCTIHSVGLDRPFIYALVWHQCVRCRGKFAQPDALKTETRLEKVGGLDCCRGRVPVDFDKTQE